jgi:hypothetical protein
MFRSGKKPRKVNNTKFTRKPRKVNNTKFTNLLLCLEAEESL